MLSDGWFFRSNWQTGSGWVVRPGFNTGVGERKAIRWLSEQVSGGSRCRRWCWWCLPWPAARQGRQRTANRKWDGGIRGKLNCRSQQAAKPPKRLMNFCVASLFFTKNQDLTMKVLAANSVLLVPPPHTRSFKDHYIVSLPRTSLSSACHLLISSNRKVI